MTKTNITKTKLFRLTPQQFANIRGTDIASLLRLISQHWGTRKCETVVNIIRSTLPETTMGVKQFKTKKSNLDKA